MSRPLHHRPLHRSALHRRFAAVCAAWLAAATLAPPTAAELWVEQEEEGGGVVDGADFSYRYYLDQMRRFPDRLGIICVNAYELDKSGRHDQSFLLFNECAERGNPPAMIYLSLMHELGLGTPPDLGKAADWLRRAAETGYSTAQYHYGKALLSGRGVAADPAQARVWLSRAAAQGDRDAARLLGGPPAGAVPGE